MNFPGSFPATGCLLAPRRANDEIAWRELQDVDIKPAGVAGWHNLLLTSSEPLLDEVRLETKYVYPFLLRQSGNRFLLVSSQAILVDFLLERSSLKRRLFCPAIDVADLARELTASPTRYVMSAVFARVEAYGQSLRTIALYGSDVGDSTLFKEVLTGLQAYRVTLRRVESGQEIISVGSRGEISFPFSGKASLVRVDDGLRFLNQANHIHWERQLAISLKERRWL